MKNAHLRLGSLEFTKWSNDSPSRIKVYLDRFIGEEPQSGSDVAQAHLISVFGNDQEIAAIWAAAATGERFVVEGPELASSLVSLGQDAQSFRGSVSLPGRKRPLRHLVALSADLNGSGLPNRTVGSVLIRTLPDGPLQRGSRVCVVSPCPAVRPAGLARVVRRFAAELDRRKAVKPLVGLGCSPVTVEGTKDLFLDWIGRSLQQKRIRIARVPGPLTWSTPAQFTDSPAPRPKQS